MLSVVYIYTICFCFRSFSPILNGITKNGFRIGPQQDNARQPKWWKRQWWAPSHLWIGFKWEKCSCCWLPWKEHTHTHRMKRQIQLCDWVKSKSKSKSKSMSKSHAKCRSQSHRWTTNFNPIYHTESTIIRFYYRDSRSPHTLTIRVSTRKFSSVFRRFTVLWHFITKRIFKYILQNIRGGYIHVSIFARPLSLIALGFLCLN